VLLVAAVSQRASKVEPQVSEYFSHTVQGEQELLCAKKPVAHCIVNPVGLSMLTLFPVTSANRFDTVEGKMELFSEFWTNAGSSCDMTLTVAVMLEPRSLRNFTAVKHSVPWHTWDMITFDADKPAPIAAATPSLKAEEPEI
jgi:hypothetical protein